MAKSETEIICTVELTEGAQERLTEALVDLYYALREGRAEGPCREVEEQLGQQAAGDEK